MQKSKNISILIVEDSLTQAIQLQFFLENNGYTVLVAEDGEIGLKLAKESQPTLIISDIVMPNMDGYEMCSAVKDTASLADTPVILLTSLSNPEDVIKALTCRADNFVTKPYDDVFLLSRIEHILVNQELRRCEKSDTGIEIFFAGKTHIITSDRRQVVDLLFSTYENAVERNKKLIRMQLELKQSNEKLQDEVHERERIAEELSRLTIHDDLTGLYNRRHMNTILAQEYARCVRYETDMSVILLDLDHFKNVNDVHGHVFGDFVLKEFSHRMKQNSRESDYVFRFGGEEFLIILPSTDIENGVLVGEKIRHISEASMFTDGLTSLKVTASLGVASYRFNEPNVQNDLLSMADKALYQAKEEGRNKVVAYSLKGI